MPLQSATTTLYTPGDNHFEDFQTWMKIGVRRDILGLFVSDTSKIDAKTEYNYSGISYFDDFEQTLTWEPIEEKDRNPLNYFARTWQNEEFGLFFNQDNPKLFIEKKMHGTLDDGSEVIMSFINNRFTLSRYEDEIEQDVLLDGIYETGLSSITLYIETNNLLEETPDYITLL